MQLKQNREVGVWEKSAWNSTRVALLVCLRQCVDIHVWKEVTLFVESLWERMAHQIVCGGRFAHSEMCQNWPRQLDNDSLNGQCLEICYPREMRMRAFSGCPLPRTGFPGWRVSIVRSSRTIFPEQTISQSSEHSTRKLTGIACPSGQRLPGLGCALGATLPSELWRAKWRVGAPDKANVGRVIIARTPVGRYNLLMWLAYSSLRIILPTAGSVWRRFIICQLTATEQSYITCITSLA